MLKKRWPGYWPYHGQVIDPNLAKIWPGYWPYIYIYLSLLLCLHLFRLFPLSASTWEAILVAQCEHFRAMFTGGRFAESGVLLCIASVLASFVIHPAREYSSSSGLVFLLHPQIVSGHVRPRQGTEICNFGAPSPLEALHWIFCFFSRFSVQFSKTSPPKSGESSEKSSGENRVKSCHVCGCHGFFGPDC